MVGLVLAVALVVPACGGGGSGGDASDADATTGTGAGDTPEPTASSGVELPPLVVDGVVSDAALDAVLSPEGDVDASVLASYGAQFQALPIEQQEVAMADLSARTELEAASISGLEAAVGDRASTEAALTGAGAQIREQSDATAAALAVQPQGIRRGRATPRATPSPDGGAVALLGLFLGYMSLGLIGTVAVKGTNTLEPGDSDVREGDGSTIGVSLDEVSTQLKFKGQQDAVDVEFTAGATIHPCPEPDGTFTIDAVIDVQASKGGAGQNAKIELNVSGTVDDNADLAEKNIENHVQWSDFAGGKGQFVDFTMSGPTGVEGFVANRGGGNVTDSFMKLAGTMGTFIGLMIATQLLDAAQQGWQSGRCVKLFVTPSAGPDGLSPSQVVSVLAEPRSKIDGQATGGNVTATLSAGGASVEPNGSPVPADATSSYTAPNEQDKSGTVSYESRSRRGIGKADVTFSTSKPAAYQIVGGLEDWQVDQVVCDITKPFTLTSPGIGVAEFSGGLSGTYSASGVYNFQYAGTYQITLSDGLGSPGSMIGTSGGEIAGQAGSGSENYALTPTTC